MEDDVTSTATMTSVTEDFSGDESDEVTGNDLETSSLVTSSDANEGFTTVIHTSLLHAGPKQFRAEFVESDAGEMSMEGDSGKEEIGTATDDGDMNSNALLSGEDQKLASASGHAKQHPPGKSSRGTEKPTNPLGKGVPFPNLLSAPGNWYEHSCFSHYWRHYQFVSMWCQKHMEVYRTVSQHHSRVTAQQQAAKEQKRRFGQGEANLFKKPTSSRTIRNRKARRRRKAAKKRIRMAVQNAELAGMNSSMSSEDVHVKEEADEEGETNESATEEDEHMEITEEMLDFFAHTHRHRKERGTVYLHEVSFIDYSGTCDFEAPLMSGHLP